MRRNRITWAILFIILIVGFSIGARYLFRFWTDRPEEPWTDTIMYGSVIGLAPIVVFVFFLFYSKGDDKTKNT